MMQCILEFVQGVWNVTGASNMAYMLAGDVHVMVLTNNVCTYLLLYCRKMWVVNSYQPISVIGMEWP